MLPEVVVAVGRFELEAASATIQPFSHITVSDIAHYAVAEASGGTRGILALALCCLLVASCAVDVACVTSWSKVVSLSHGPLATLLGMRAVIRYISEFLCVLRTGTVARDLRRGGPGDLP